MVDPIGPVVPVIALVVGPCPLLKMFRVNTQPVMAAMANHIIEAEHLLVQGAEGEAVCSVLLTPEANFPWRRRASDDTSFLRSLTLTHQTAGKGFGFFGMVRQDTPPRSSPVRSPDRRPVSTTRPPGHRTVDPLTDIALAGWPRVPWPFWLPSPLQPSRSRHSPNS